MLGHKYNSPGDALECLALSDLVHQDDNTGSACEEGMIVGFSVQKNQFFCYRAMSTGGAKFLKYDQAPPGGDEAAIFPMTCYKVKGVPSSCVWLRTGARSCAFVNGHWQRTPNASTTGAPLAPVQCSGGVEYLDFPLRLMQLHAANYTDETIDVDVNGDGVADELDPMVCKNPDSRRPIATASANTFVRPTRTESAIRRPPASGGNGLRQVRRRLFHRRFPAT